MERAVKRLRMRHTWNIRDMGGYETEDGRVTAFHRLLRSGGLELLSEKEWERLVEYGVRTVIDLRSLAEIETKPDQVPKQIVWKHYPIQPNQIDENDIAGSALKAFTNSLTDGYINIVKNHGELLTAAIKQVIESMKYGAVLFHCSAGKDRTGVLASAIYYLTGIEDEDIIADYEVSCTYNRRVISRYLEQMKEAEKEKMLPFIHSDAESMEHLLKFYNEVNLPQYLISYGLELEEIETLRRLFLLEE